MPKKEKREDEEDEAEAVKRGSQTPQKKIKLSERDSPVFKQERKRRHVLIDSDTEEEDWMSQEWWHSMTKRVSLMM